MVIPCKGPFDQPPVALDKGTDRVGGRGTVEGAT